MSQEETQHCTRFENLTRHGAEMTDARLQAFNKHDVNRAEQSRIQYAAAKRINSNSKQSFRILQIKLLPNAYQMNASSF